MNPWIATSVTLALVYRAVSRNSLTPLGIVAAVFTAVSHAIHPWSVFFTLLVVFFLAGTQVTKVKHEIKAKLTHSSSGTSGGEGPRNHVQVLANSFTASVLILAHAYKLRQRDGKEHCLSYTSLPMEDALVYGIIANYAAVASDTFSSELGILSKSQPRLIIAPWRTVPPGTNGGVSITGLQAGLLGAFTIAATATALLPFCADWTPISKIVFTLAMTAVGLCGSILDSVLGALCQASVIDVRSGKVVEGVGGSRVPVVAAATVYRNHQWVEGRPPSRMIAVGRDILSNNAVNFVMAGSMSLLAVLAAEIMWRPILEPEVIVCES